MGHHEILVSDGRFVGSTRQDLAASFSSLAASPPGTPLILHFHGGLVPEEGGKAIAAQLLPRYREEAGAWPIFPIWRSGPVETIRNNWDEIVREDVFPLIVERVSRFLLGKIEQNPGDKGIKVDEPPLAEVKDEIAVANAAGEEPFADREDEAASLGPTLPEAERRQFEQQLTRDNVFLAKADELTRQDGPHLAAGLAAEADLARAADVEGNKGIVSTALLVAAATRVLARSLQRLARGRGHGIYTTAVEEAARDLLFGE